MEVCVAGEFGQHWGTVCSNQTELQNMLIAEQACRQLGFEGPSTLVQKLELTILLHDKLMYLNVYMYYIST